MGDKIVMKDNFFKKFSIYSIRSKMTICFLALGLIPILVFGFISYHLYLLNLHKNVANYSEQVIERVDKNLETYISDIENIMRLKSNYYFQQYSKLNETGDIEGNRKYIVRIWETFDSLKQMKTDLVDIRYISSSGSAISCYGRYWGDLTTEPLYGELVTKKNDVVAIQPPHLNILNKKVFSIGQAVNRTAKGDMGIMAIDIDVNFLKKICSDIKLGDTGFVFFEKDGKVVFTPESSDKPGLSNIITQNTKLINSKNGNLIESINNTNYIITYKTSDITRWKIIGVTPEAEMTREVSTLREVFFWIITLIIIIILLLTIYLTSVLTNPMRKLRSIMKQASENDLSIYADIRTRDEIGQLASSFNKMMNQIRELMDKVKDDQQKIRVMEMKAMQELIKPHFVYNTLDSIIGLLEQNRNEDAIDIVDSLGKFFRTSLSHGREVVFIREEIDHIRSYLMIQQFRFSYKFDYLFEIDDGIYNFKTVKLILQPLVENSIYHGIRNLDKKGLIVINGYLKDDQVIFEISDNGEGIYQEKMEQLNRIMAGRKRLRIRTCILVLEM
ncbi:sensor histidine kinase [Ruminiclostridium josui]|uniref:sensor histidine kinase n=2 Tax=Ruminiclostridium josui TaxID=1499 RepID=UPI000B0140DE|nr:histidine kinase [Ruminiclostridium josui]